MRTTTIWISALTLALTVGALTIYAAKVGQPAPAFTATDTLGKVHALSALKGKWVVLEWHNNGCPYVKRHYSGNMQKLQQEWTARGVVWLTVISSAPGMQGYVTPAEANAYAKAAKAAPTAILLDPKGDLGYLYEARTTPHMYVINPRGVLVYNGAIDNKPSTDPSDNETATNYVSAALREGTAGKPITTPTSRPYGCSVKYAPDK
jgi:alkyl hydroperoxide reductase subunit AhpC